MIKIGDFSKMTHITVKALRYYEKEGILIPASVDEWTGYRYYTSEQLCDAAAIRSYRQLGLSLGEISSILSGGDAKAVLSAKREELLREKERLGIRLCVISSILEESNMKYQVTEKTIPEAIVYTSETVLKSFSDIMQWIPSVGEECLRLNPGIKCAEPEYEFCEYLDGEPSEANIRVRHNEAVTSFGKENELISFRTLPEAKVLSVYHKGAYESIGEAYSFLLKYAETNGYEKSGPPRECYIDGIWNRDAPDEWLTEIQLPVR